jgi:hypothetical protein
MGKGAKRATDPATSRAPIPKVPYQHMVDEVCVAFEDSGNDFEVLGFDALIALIGSAEHQLQAINATLDGTSTEVIARDGRRMTISPVDAPDPSFRTTARALKGTVDECRQRSTAVPTELAGPTADSGDGGETKKGSVLETAVTVAAVIALAASATSSGADARQRAFQKPIRVRALRRWMLNHDHILENSAISDLCLIANDKASKKSEDVVLVFGFLVRRSSAIQVAIEMGFEGLIELAQKKSGLRRKSSSFLFGDSLHEVAEEDLISIQNFRMKMANTIIDWPGLPIKVKIKLQDILKKQGGAQIISGTRRLQERLDRIESEISDLPIGGSEYKRLSTERSAIWLRLRSDGR